MLPAVHNRKAIVAQYIKYLMKYRKDWTRSLNIERITAFENHLKRLAEFRNADADKTFTFQVSTNEFSDWTEEEMQVLSQGYKEEDGSDKHQSSRHTIDIESEDSGESDNDGKDDGGESTNKTPETFNWDSDDNSLGHPVYASTRSDGSICRLESPIINQGLCGSCWAFAASGAVAASVMINTGVGVRLSAQELLDCDRSYNRGCNGGSPAVALAYTLEAGSSTARSYAYRGMSTAQCRSHVPVVGIQGVVRITPYDPALIQTFLLSTGPVSVGVCGNDFAFLFYGGGVFNYNSCCTAQTHAMLLVGYGGGGIDGTAPYWVLRNSWGTSWGEKGYMRLRRYMDPTDTDVNTDVDAGTENYSSYSTGLCGVNLNPSVPTGGYVLSMPEEEEIASNDPSGGVHSEIMKQGGSGSRVLSGTDPSMPAWRSLECASSSLSAYERALMTVDWARDHWIYTLLILFVILYLLRFCVVRLIKCLCGCCSSTTDRDLQKQLEYESSCRGNNSCDNSIPVISNTGLGYSSYQHDQQRAHDDGSGETQSLMYV